VRTARRPPDSTTARRRGVARGLVAAPTYCLFVALVLLLLCAAALGFDAAPEPAHHASEPTYITSRPADLWLFLPLGYLLSVAVETPVLLAGLSRRLSFGQKLFAGLWLTACTYPVVVLVLPRLFSTLPRSTYLLAAETFAPVAECLLFWLAFRARAGAGGGELARNFAVIVLANLLSFGAGEALNATHWFGLF
jgi:hypothetical protein